GAAVLRALHPIDAAVHLYDTLRIKPGTLKLAIDIGSENECSASHPPSPGLQELEALMRLRRAVEIEPMAVKAPSERRIAGKPLRVRQGRKAESEFLVRRIGTPEPLVAPKIGQAGIDRHAGSRGKQQRVRRRHGSRGSLDQRFLDHAGTSPSATRRVSAAGAVAPTGRPAG